MADFLIKDLPSKFQKKVISAAEVRALLHISEQAVTTGLTQAFVASASPGQGSGRSPIILPARIARLHLREPLSRPGPHVAAMAHSKQGGRNVSQDLATSSPRKLKFQLLQSLTIPKRYV